MGPEEIGKLADQIIAAAEEMPKGDMARMYLREAATFLLDAKTAMEIEEP